MSRYGKDWRFLAIPGEREKRWKRGEKREKKEQMVERTMDRKMAMSDLEMEIEKRDFGAVREHVTR